MQKLLTRLTTERTTQRAKTGLNLLGKMWLPPTIIPLFCRECSANETRTRSFINNGWVYRIMMYLRSQIICDLCSAGRYGKCTVAISCGILPGDTTNKMGSFKKAVCMIMPMVIGQQGFLIRV